MKSIRRIYGEVLGALMFVGNAYVFAQNPPAIQWGIEMPEAVSALLWSGNVDSAIVELEAFKKAQTNVDPYHMLYMEMTVYRDAQMVDAANAEKYKDRYDALLQQLSKKYPNRSDTYLLQITPESTPEQIVELATKAINADSTNRGAYEMRSRALYQLGKSKEAEADARKARGM